MAEGKCSIVRYQAYGHASNEATFRAYMLELGRKLTLAKQVTAVKQRIATARGELRSRVAAARIHSEVELLRLLSDFSDCKRKAANPDPGIFPFFGGDLLSSIVATKMNAELNIRAIVNLLTQIFALRQREEELTDNPVSPLSREAKTAFRRAMEQLHPDKTAANPDSSALITALSEAQATGDEVTVKGIAELTCEGIEDVDAIEAYLASLTKKERALSSETAQIPHVDPRDAAVQRTAAKEKLSTRPLQSDLATEIKDPTLLKSIRNWLEIV